MKTFLLVIATYGAAVLETSLGDLLAIGRVGPDLLALVAVLWVLWSPGKRSFLGAGLVGLASDLLSPGRLGVATGSFLILGYVLARLRGRLPLRRPVWQVATLFLAVTLLAAALGIAGRLSGEVPIPWAVVAGRASGVGLYTAGLSLPVVMIYGWTRCSPSRVESWG